MSKAHEVSPEDETIVDVLRYGNCSWCLMTFQELSILFLYLSGPSLCEQYVKICFTVLVAFLPLLFCLVCEASKTCSPVLLFSFVVHWVHFVPTIYSSFASKRSLLFAGQEVFSHGYFQLDLLNYEAWTHDMVQA